jgi:hypothetical protein
MNWVYDPAKDMAYKYADAAAASGAQTAPLRANLVQIPSGRNRVLEWMRSFANMQDPEIKAQLSTALDGDGALYRFGNLVRSMRLQRSWGHFHVQRVLATIEDWAASNSVRPNNVTAPLCWPVHPTEPLLGASVSPVAPSPPVAETTLRTTSTALTGRLDSLIDDLIDELIKLRGFLQVVGPKRS